MRCERDDVGRKVQTAAVGGSSSGFFALERRAQNDSKNKQRRRTNNDVKQATAKCGGFLHYPFDKLRVRSG
jgi:hypothetical protein